MLENFVHTPEENSRRVAPRAASMMMKSLDSGQSYRIINDLTLPET